MINVNDSRSSSRNSSHGQHGMSNYNTTSSVDSNNNYNYGTQLQGPGTMQPHLQNLGSGPSPSLMFHQGGRGGGNNFGGVNGDNGNSNDSRLANANHLANGGLNNADVMHGTYQRGTMQSNVKLECPSPSSSNSQPQAQAQSQSHQQQFFQAGHNHGNNISTTTGGNGQNQNSNMYDRQIQNSNAISNPPNSTPAAPHHDPEPQLAQPIQLCASCDRCRARKTKCDGGRPCGNCANRFKKQNKLGAETTVEELRGLVVDYAEFDCVYSPAKRRGPIPGKTGASQSQGQHQNQNQNRGQVRKAGDMGAMMGMPMGQAWNGQGQMQGQGQRWQGLDQGQGYFGSTTSNAGISAATAHPGGGGFGTDGSAAGFGMTNLNNNNMANSMTNNMNNSMNNINANSNANNSSNGGSDELKQILALQQQLLLQQQQLQEHQRNQGVMGQLATLVGGLNPQNLNNSSGSAQGTIPNFNQMQPQHQHQQQQQQHSASNTPFALSSQNQSPMVMSQQQQHLSHQYSMEDRSTKRAHRPSDGSSNNADSKNQAFSAVIANHLHLLQPNNDDGKILRSYYQISVNDVLNLPPIPSDEEYLLRLANAGPNLNNNYNNNYNSNNNYNNIPLYDQAALQAARFAELSLGALANNQAPLALELSNASVMCLRNCIEEPGHELCLYDIARAYLLLGIFRSYRGDVVRYFKYRRVCMSHVARLRGVPHVDALVAAISFHDSWAYMIHNASEENIPDIDDILPRPGGCGNATGPGSHSADIAGDATNKNWIQGAPSIFLDNEAPAINRSLDALACAVRSCCDQANLQVEEMARQAGMDMPGSNSCAGGTATAQAVMANENELCSRNIVLSAQTLLNQHAGTSAEKTEKHGLRLMVLSMEAFLDGGDEDNTGGFTDKQVKNLLKVCEIILKNPHLLHAPGPLYHMVSNVAILLCHLLNGMHANCSASAGSSSESNGGVEGVLFDEVMDSFMAVRKLLNLHRKCLPVRLRCHGIPKPNVGPFRKTMSPEAPFVDLGETLMCASRGCQGFVLMGCSPCVAAERAMSAAKAHAREGDNVDEDEFQRELGDLGDDFNLDDDTLFNILSRIVQN